MMIHGISLTNITTENVKEDKRASIKSVKSENKFDPNIEFDNHREKFKTLHNKSGLLN